MSDTHPVTTGGGKLNAAVFGEMTGKVLGLFLVSVVWLNITKATPLKRKPVIAYGIAFALPALLQLAIMRSEDVVARN